jgi:hypothetical protein
MKPRTKFWEQLVQLDACHDAQRWVGNKSLAVAWKTCKRGDWLLWLAAESGVDRRLVVEAACRCAEAVIGLVPESEERPWKALETARAWTRGEASLGEVWTAGAAAYVAHTAPAYFAAVAYAACTAGAAGYAVTAASYAAEAAAVYAEADRATALADCADLVRQVITAADVAQALGRGH